MKQFLILVFLLATMKASAQNMAINNDGSAAHAKAILELKSTDKGLIIPRMTQAQRSAMFTVPDITAKATLVYQTDGTEGYYYYDGANWKNLQVGGTSNGWDLLGNSGTTPTTNFLGTTDNTGLSVKTNNTERIRISESGMIGINKSSPTVTLDLVSPNLIPMRIKSENNNGYSGIQFVSNTPAVTGHIGYANSAAANFPNSVYSGSITSIPYVLTTADQERMRITESGTIGIGTTAPASKMEILANSSTGYQHLRITENEDDFSRLGYYTNTKTNFWETAAFTGNNTATSYFNVYNSSSGNLLTVRGDGNVGIAHGDPTFPLTFNNNLGGKITFWTNGANNTNFGIGIQTSRLQIHTANSNDDVVFGYGSSANFTENVRFKGNGHVGIGTETPSNKLHVSRASSGITANANSTIVAENNGANYINLLTTGESGVLFSGNNTATDGGIIYNNAAYPQGLILRNNANTNRMVINKDGDVLVGSANILTRMVIQKSDSARPILSVFNSNASGYSGTWYVNSGAFAAGMFGFANPTAPKFANNTYAGSYGNFGFILATNNTERMRITETGNVGVGTSSPTTDFEVNGFSKLGSDAPAIKMKKLTGTTAATEGSQVTINHGLNPAKIISIAVMVEWQTNSYIHPNYNWNPGYNFSWFSGNTGIAISNTPGNSVNILSKPVKILITYEE